MTISFKAGLLAGLLTFGGISSAFAEDPYLWLEEREGADALKWVTEQSAKARSRIASDPRFGEYASTSVGIYTATDTMVRGNVRDGYLYNFVQDKDHPLGSWRRATVSSYRDGAPAWDTLLDIDALARTEGVKWVFKGADCVRPAFIRCLISMSPDGGDATEVREFDIADKAFVKDGFFSPISKSYITWSGPDAVLAAVAYTDDQRTASGYARILKMWERGETIDEAETLMEVGVNDFDIWGYTVYGGERPYTLMARDIDFYNLELFLQAEDGEVRRVPLPTGVPIYHVFKDDMVFSLREAWTAPDGRTYQPGGLYSFDLRRWAETGEMSAIETLLAPSPKISLQGVLNTKDTLFVALMDNIRGRVLGYRKSAGEWSSTRIALPDNGSAYINDADATGTTVSFGFENFVTPASILWSDDDGATLGNAQVQPASFDPAQFVSEQLEVASKDGTMIPYFVVRPKELKGPVPTLLYGYGGFEVSMVPFYSQLIGELWLGKGNIYVLANIRGGGEFGPAWHQAAIKENRQKAYDDFAAIAEDLVRRGFTTPSQLGAMGGSNGGLLAGVMLTQRPELFGAVISEVPLLDMLRYTQLPAGASWIAEYGDPAIPEEAAYIAKYSPYQNVKPDGNYPPALFITSTADDRVHPSHARKMAALMQSFGHPAEFYEETTGGHGGAGDLRAAALITAHIYLFLQRTLEGEAAPELLAEGPASALMQERSLGLDSSPQVGLDCTQMAATNATSLKLRMESTSSMRSRHAEMMRLCARIGYSPPTLH